MLHDATHSSESALDFEAPPVVPSTLKDNERELIATAYSCLKANLPGFKERSQQRIMIDEVANTVAENALGLIEAPTGTGKSASYMLPSAVIGKLRGKKVIVSTATTSLQDQLAKKDAPLIASALNAAGMGEIKFAVAKGRERHVCVSKLRALTEQGALFEGEHASTETTELQVVADLWKGGLWDGVRDSIPKGVRPVIWARVANTSATCTGKACIDVAECPYYVNLKALDAANIIITNHDYLLACLVNSPKSTLTQTNDNIYVFDEAHHLGEKCLSAFAKSIDLTSDFNLEVISVMTLMHKSLFRIEIALERCTALRKALADGAYKLLKGSPQYRFPFGSVPTYYVDGLILYQSAVADVVEQVTSAADDYSQENKADLLSPSEQDNPGHRNSPMMQMATMRINTVKADLKTFSDGLEFFLDEAQEKARWIAQTRSGLVLECSPFDASVLAKQFLWSRIKTAVLTSATLGDIPSTVRGLGLPWETRTLKLDSPLDYSRSQIIVPRLIPDGTSSDHIEATHDFIKRDAFDSTAKGILVYFTSKKHLKEVYDLLTTAERAITLVQGQLSPTAMIKAHKERIDLGVKSVLFGLDSLSEGIDLPGLYCSCVIIAKLPFPSPSDPVLATHAEVLKRRGMNAFPLLMLPRALVKFSQVVGRLIRQEGDWGTVIVLDQRMITKQYGKQLLQGTSFAQIDHLTKNFGPNSPASVSFAGS